MSDEPSLPDNPADWPSDPYQLLGVSNETDRRELRRAYHALLRRYKPEKSPEEFRRIREAYEYLLRIVEFREQYGINLATSGPQPGSVEGDAPPASDPSARAIPLDDPAQAWRDGIEGDPTALYNRLRQLLPENTNNAALYARLYWLLRVAPELDPARKPEEWLVEGLHRAPDAPGPLPELYRRAANLDAELAMDDRVTQLFNLRPTREWLYRVVEPRWRHARRAGRWSLIAVDAQRLRQSFDMHDDLQTQFTLLALAMQELWFQGESETDEVASDMFHYLEQHCGDDPRFYDQLAYLDQRRMYAQSWLEASRSRIDPAFPELLALVDNDDRERLRPALLRWLSKKPPRQLYEMLHNMAINRPLLVRQFALLVSAASAYSPEIVETEWSGVLLRDTVRDFLEVHITLTNDIEFYCELLTFCLQNAVSPARVAEVMNQHRNAWQAIGELPTILEQNVPLALCYAAYRMLRG